MEDNIFNTVKKIIHKVLRGYKDISRISGGCAYIPPGCLTSPGREQKEVRAQENAAKHLEPKENKAERN
ncbi:hypothetical protein [Treponema parvum]|uniref:hypothetical protein n=1 Tax=Treponema parvum TaxID=138851 RepID=UPI001AEBDDE6|nr:hypothetical protein [Treponema parvum]QTQ15356.1 hypothetical protein HXT04_00805 [Treponema parvum]